MSFAARLFNRLDVPEAQPADAILSDLIDRERVIDRFDATYLDDLDKILAELHGLTQESLSGHPLQAEVNELWRLAGRDGTPQLAELGHALVAGNAVTPALHTPRQTPEKEKRRQGYNRAGSWRRAAGRRIGDIDPEVVNALQADYSRQWGATVAVEFENLGRPETGDPWTSFIAGLVERGELDRNEPVLTIGPRWVGEITYFREALGLVNAIGLDLFTTDESLVKVGDMHTMPFGNDTFGLVYQRNTFNKAYDIRAVLGECARVLRDGGILISDDCYDYTTGVSELGRTNIKHNDQIVRVLASNVSEVLYDREEPSRETWIERVGQVAVRIRKH
jgi:SAM-dependent methyltransferase